MIGDHFTLALLLGLFHRENGKQCEYSDFHIETGVARNPSSGFRRLAPPSEHVVMKIAME
jgi:hypothetical protein